MNDERDGPDTVPDYASAPGDGRAGRNSYAPGAIIGDVWNVEKTLGKGGMGSVYRCHNKHAPRILAAIKLLDPAFQYHPEAKARFLREAEILYTVDHANVVKVSNVHLDARPPYLEMEFIDGLALEDELAQFGALPMAVALDRAKQLASALRYLHRKNIYHRDVKPQNILIRKDGALKLVDFGLATEAGGDRITQTDTVNFGTVSYCPPEWGRNAHVDPAIWDLYGLGVVLYEMLTGTVAFPVASQADPRRQMLQVMTDKQRVEALDPGPRFEPSLREIVRRLTKKEPDGRIADAKSLGVMLDQVDIGWTPASGTSRMPMRTVATDAANRRSGVLGVLGVLGAIAGVGLAVGVVLAIGLLLFIGLRPATRDAEVAVGGVAADVPVSVRVADQPASRVEGLRHHVLRVPVGDVRVEWAAGPGCVAPCGGDACAPWCTSGSATHAVAEGDGAALIALDVRGPTPRAVEVRADGVTRGFVRLGALQEPFVDGAARFGSVQPGPWEMFAAAGDCAPACTDDCGPACAVLEQSLAVGAASTAMRVELELAEPSAVVAPIPARPTGVRPVPRSSGPVSRAQFASWLRANPEWTRSEARTSGRAGSGYLASWTDEGPPEPASAPVTQVTWTAAAAFCASRGGLAGVDGEPTTWESGPMMEWRAGPSGERRWRRMDGDVNKAGVRTDEANSGTTFRCAN